MQLMDIGYWRLKLTLECICNPEFTLAEVQRSKAELKCWDLISFVHTVTGQIESSEPSDSEGMLGFATEKG